MLCMTFFFCAPLQSAGGFLPYRRRSFIYDKKRVLHRLIKKAYETLFLFLLLYKKWMPQTRELSATPLLLYLPLFSGDHPNIELISLFFLIGLYPTLA